MADGYEEVSLEQMLEAREKRVERQRELIGMYHMPLISFTINMPGKYKNTYASNVIFIEGYNELVKELIESRCYPVHKESYNLVTGYQAYIVADADASKLKELALKLEHHHPLGRMFDFDVIGYDGLAISREMLGFTSRKCLICEKNAHVCARSRAHSVDELIKKIISLVDSFIKQRSVFIVK